MHVIYIVDIDVIYLLYFHTHTHTTHICAHTRTHAYDTHMCTHTHACTHAPTHAHTHHTAQATDGDTNTSALQLNKATEELVLLLYICYVGIILHI